MTRRGHSWLRGPELAQRTGQSFNQAFAVSRAQQTRTFELRACLDLARLYCDIGREREARDLLAPALVGFTETPELPEIGEANRLLSELGGGSGQVTCELLGVQPLVLRRSWIDPWRCITIVVYS